jgi:hypothetical protein
VLGLILAEPGALGWKVTSDGGLAGYAVLRPDGDGFHLGPLLARDEECIRVLLGVAAAHSADKPVSAHTFESPLIVERFRDAGLEQISRSLRLTHGTPKHLLTGNALSHRKLPEPSECPLVATTCSHLG